MRWTEQDYLDYLKRQGMPLTPVHTTPQNTLPDDTPEGSLLARVRRLATDNSYISYHTHDSRKSDLGFPDLCLARTATSTSSGRLIFAELKDRKGKVTREQQLWLDMLAHTIPGVEVYLWRPADFSDIMQILLRK
jgi:VRR-NUC domain